MQNSLVRAITFDTLQARTTKAILGQTLFVAVALLVPTITHRLGLDYKIAQPMHWMILFAGITYGPWSGLIAGLAVPLLSFVISGMPVPMVLPLMMAELGVYGALSGLLKKNLSAFGSIAVSLLAGKAVFLALILFLGRTQLPVSEYIIATWAPSLITMVIQIVALPILAGLYMKAVSRD